ncbi:hypothetical protein DL240_10500 [Lujinxingia litoralis]|uniref:DoxX family protein n=2 Tax=Lujinxingia litoralis TaxID=2211119 RepID=A0A328C666_9DELT|nr:hypothetical protein DL240_10500 [Lujinxingia litoralis]
MMLSTIFIVAGASHLVDPAKTAARLEGSPLGYLATSLAPAEPLVVLSGVALLVGGVALLVGVYTRAAALGLLALIIPITITVQIGNMAALGPLFKNVGLAGGLIFFITHGSDAFGVDAWRSARRDSRVH